MALNLTTKYSPLIAERFKANSFTEDSTSDRFDFDGAKSVVVYTVDKAVLHDYDREASGNRFGEISELGDTKQVLTLSQDKAFTFAIDNGNNSDQLNVKHCNEQIKSNWDEICVPFIDKYRLNRWIYGAGISLASAVPSKTTIIEKIFALGNEMTARGVPLKNRTLFISLGQYNNLKQAGEVIGSEALGTESISKGVVGSIDGMNIVPVPEAYLPTGLYFMIKHKDASVDPMKLKTLRVQKNPVGIDGDVGECRFYFDSFVLDPKLNGIAICGGTADVCAMPTITATTNGVIVAGTVNSTNRYTTDGSNPKTSDTAQDFTGGTSATLALSGPCRVRVYIIPQNTRVVSGVSEFNYVG
ncbi:MAG: hypothetical protein LBO63_02565 [Oscillospiraceae bacterium]|jgi:hypothetical protein|nr:hypothetical protein [Oscillospiraceae bacterium]